MVILKAGSAPVRKSEIFEDRISMRREQEGRRVAPDKIQTVIDSVEVPILSKVSLVPTLEISI